MAAVAMTAPSTETTLFGEVASCCCRKTPLLVVVGALVIFGLVTVVLIRIVFEMIHDHRKDPE